MLQRLKIGATLKKPWFMRMHIAGVAVTCYFSELRLFFHPVSAVVKNKQRNLHFSYTFLFFVQKQFYRLALSPTMPYPCLGLEVEEPS
jgi:hypothetical protein